ncbi:hypothetical protein TSAR_001843 [Trichomalopsis sarcophagae]|uniref:Uncharacterized protein n=1 Tax=Trichomalopsis sarcophagae TaxID=543379 RepID=A0A232F663_9HYME|nr:hypothetical protein TSAR_001843 [Trichomalopsis sarcophagae]
MDESGIDMGFDLAALANAEAHLDDLEYSNELEQALALLPSSQDFMYYELKSRAPDTGRNMKLEFYNIAWLFSGVKARHSRLKMPVKRRVARAHKK